MVSNKTIWGIHTTDDLLFLSQNIIAIGWPEMGDLSQLPPSRDEFKERFLKTYPNGKKGTSDWVGECWQYFVPNSRWLMQRQTTFFLPFLDQVVRRYMESHSPQTNLSDKAYLLQYFPSTLLVFFWETFFLLFLRVSSSWAFRKSSRGMMAGWLSVM